MFKPLRLLALCAALLCSATPALSEDTIKIGVPGAHSGDLASYGVPSLRAAQLVVDDYNARGGILGKKLEIIAQDDQCKPELATNAATRLISDQVNVVMGHICSGATVASLPLYTNAKIISMSPSATTPQLTQSGEYPYFFRTIAHDFDQARLAASFIANRLQAKSIAMIHDNGDYGRGYVEAVRDNLGEKANIVLFEAVNPDAVDFSTVVRKLRRAKADVLVFGGYHPTASKLIQQMRRERVTIPMVGPDGLKDPALIKMAGKDAEGIYTSQPQDTSDLPAYKHARQLHLDKYNAEPGAFYYNAFAATQALINAMEKAGTCTDTQKIMDTLRKEYVDTPVGRIRFNERGEAVGVGLAMYQVKNGDFVELEDRIMLD